MWKIIKWILLVVLAAGIFWLANLIWFKPFNMNHYVDREAIKFLMQSPETMTQLRLLDKFGITGHNAELDDASDASGEKMFRFIEEFRDGLNEYDDDSLSENQLLTKDIVGWFLDTTADLEKFRHHNYPVNQLFGIQNGFPSFMDSAHQIDDLDAADDYITRLTIVDTKFEQVMGGLKVRQRKGIVPPTFVIEKVLDEMTKFVEQPVEENILYTSFTEKLNKLEDIDPAVVEDYQQKVADAIRSDVHPAYQSFIDYFSSLQDVANNDAGVWKFPNGDEYYRLALRGFTTVDRDPSEIHQTGLDEVARIQSEMMAVMAAEGYDISSGFQRAWQQVVDDPRFYYPDTDTGREQILKDYKAIIDEIETRMPEVFSVAAKADLEVKRIPVFKEKTAPGAYYQGAPLDGSKPGTFYANLYDIKATPRYGMRTLAYHEGIPGHHWQVSIQRELEDVPFVRTLVPFPAYSEGWALYSEQLAWEIGMQNDSFDNLGRLQAELFRAVRLVVDTGIHAKRWTREQAIDYMATNTGMAMSDVVSEIERYIVMPGQACAYKVGMMEILRLRAKAKAELGDKFDIRQFHDVVLKNGAVPMAVLAQLVDRYIEQQR